MEKMLFYLKLLIFINQHDFSIEETKVAIKINLSNIQRLKSFSGIESMKKCPQQNYQDYVACPFEIYLKIGNKFKINVINVKKNDDRKEVLFFYSVPKQDAISNLFALFFISNPTETIFSLYTQFLQEVIFSHPSFTYVDYKCFPCQSRYGVFSYTGTIKSYDIHINTPAYRYLIILFENFQIEDSHNIPCSSYTKLIIQNDFEFINCYLTWYFFSSGNVKIETNIYLDPLYKKYDGMISSFSDDGKFFVPGTTFKLKLYSVITKTRTQNPIYEKELTLNLDPFEALDISEEIGVSSKFKLKAKIFFRTKGFSGKNAAHQNEITNEKYQKSIASPFWGEEKCGTIPCKNGGRCFGTKNNFRCKCLQNTYGKLCEHFDCPKKCPNSECIGMDVCSSECNPGWSGENCDQPKCDTDKVCLNGASCVLEDKLRKCDCDKTKYTGEYCQIQCLRTCVYGVCDILNGAPRCICQKNYYGASCSEPYTQEKLVFDISFLFYAKVSFLIACYVLIIAYAFYLLSNFFINNSTDRYTEYDETKARKNLEEIIKTKEEKLKEIKNEPAPIKFDEGPSNYLVDSDNDEDEKKDLKIQSYVVNPDLENEESILDDSKIELTNDSNEISNTVNLVDDNVDDDAEKNIFDEEKNINSPESDVEDVEEGDNNADE